MRAHVGRRPEVMLLAALLVFAMALAWRAFQNRPQAPLAKIGDYAFQDVHRTGEEIAAVGAGVEDEDEGGAGVGGEAGTAKAGSATDVTGASARGVARAAGPADATDAIASVRPALPWPCSATPTSATPASATETAATHRSRFL